jgi:hypothetical protein
MFLCTDQSSRHLSKENQLLVETFLLAVANSASKASFNAWRRCCVDKELEEDEGEEGRRCEAISANEVFPVFARGLAATA